jgi:hypothetical protein
MKLHHLINHTRLRVWVHHGLGFVWRVGQFNVSASIVEAHHRLRQKSHVIFTWFHFICYVYICSQVIYMAYRGETEKSINWGLIAILTKPTDSENKIIGK